jgi:hypothetical protein
MESTTPPMNAGHRVGERLFWVIVFSTAFAFVESSVVVYLRALYYPEGFAFPLKLIAQQHLMLELVREMATIVMLVAVGWIAGITPWEKFAYFLVAFGVWDICFYVWLKVILGWPPSIVAWDILFLIPVPWIGPVVAPVLISLLMIVAGVTLALRIARNAYFRPQLWSWILVLGGTGILFWSFMQDTAASLGGSFPQPYRYELLICGLILYGVGFLVACKRKPSISA